MMLSKVRVFNGFPMRMELMVCMGSRNYLNGNKILILVIDHLFNLIRVKMSMPQDPLSTNYDILTRTPRIFNCYLSTISGLFGSEVAPSRDVSRPSAVMNGLIEREKTRFVIQLTKNVFITLSQRSDRSRFIRPA